MQLACEMKVHIVNTYLKNAKPFLQTKVQMSLLQDLVQVSILLRSTVHRVHKGKRQRDVAVATL